jgi:cytochrome c-type biogenesis protein CcmH
MCAASFTLFLHHNCPNAKAGYDTNLIFSDMRRFAPFCGALLRGNEGQIWGNTQMIFWIVTAVLGLAVAAILAMSLVQKPREQADAASFDVQVYRDQLKDIARDLARGVVTAVEADALKTEVSRRLLAADAKVQSGDGVVTTGGAPKIAALLIAPMVLAGAFALYQQLGAPGYPDLPIQARLDAAEAARENRPAQAVAEAEADLRNVTDVPAGADFLALMDQLRATIAQRPTDQQGLVLLARNEAQLGNFKAAYAAQQQLIAVKGDAVEPDDYANLADLMILAAGGYVSPEAESVLVQTLDIDPRNGAARYYSGLMFSQTGRPDAAFEIWRTLLEESPPDAGWVPPIRAQIEDMAMRTGVSYTLPDPNALAGPDADAIAAAQDMTPEDRQNMIQGMVAGLSERLATDGGSADEWARLINALAILNRLDEADAIWDEAKVVFKDDASGYKKIYDTAREWDLVN